MKKLIVTAWLVLSLLLVLLNYSTQAEESEFQDPKTNILKAVPDAVLVRPVAAVAAMVPTAAFIATLPPAYVTGYSLKTATVLVQKPWDYVSNRPVGVFFPKEPPVNVINTEMTKQYQEFLSRTNADVGNLDLR